MRIAVFLDAPHQKKYVDVVRETLVDMPEATVEGVGPAMEQSHAPVFQTIADVGRRNLIQTSAKLVAKRPYMFARTALSQSLFFALFLEMRRRWYVAKSVFAFSPDHIILLEDNAQGLTGVVTQMARERSIPFSVLPDYIPNPAEPAGFYFSDPNHTARTWAGKIVLRFYSQWALQYEGRILLRLPAAQILAKQLKKGIFPQPWILNSGYCEAIYLESQAMKDHYQKLGFAEQKLRVVGGAMEDKLHEISSNRDALRNKLMDRYAFDSQKPLILCAFPPDQYNASTVAYEYRDYRDLCEAWFEELGDVTQSANIVVVRHPRLSAAKLTKYLKPKVILADQPIEELLPLCDLYVACVSTTIRSALALGIPAINYDCYRYAYGDFSRAAAIKEVDNRQRFRAVLQETIAQSTLTSLKALAIKDAAYWGIVDGGFKARLREAILEVNQAYRGKPIATHEATFRLGK